MFRDFQKTLEPQISFHKCWWGKLEMCWFGKVNRIPTLKWWEIILLPCLKQFLTGSSQIGSYLTSSRFSSSRNPTTSKFTPWSNLAQKWHARHLSESMCVVFWHCPAHLFIIAAPGNTESYNRNYTFFLLLFPSFGLLLVTAAPHFRYTNFFVVVVVPLVWSQN